MIWGPAYAACHYSSQLMSLNSMVHTLICQGSKETSDNHFIHPIRNWMDETLNAAGQQQGQAVAAARCEEAHSRPPAAACTSSAAAGWGPTR